MDEECSNSQSYEERAVLRSMTDLKGFTIGATDGDIGQVEAFYFDDASFTVRHLVVDTGGWLGGRKVLISPRALRDIDWDGRRINAALTKAQVEKSPNIDTDQPVSRQHEIEYYRYYGYPSYWSGPYLWGGYPFPVMSSDQATLENERRWEWGTEESGDRHLRSSAAVIGYYIAATDGELGHVEDFLICDVVDPLHGGGHEQLVVRQEGAGVVRVDHQGGLERVSAARRHDARADQEQPRVRSIRSRATRLRDEAARPLRPAGLLE